MKKYLVRFKNLNSAILKGEHLTMISAADDVTVVKEAEAFVKVHNGSGYTIFELNRIVDVTGQLSIFGDEGKPETVFGLEIPQSDFEYTSSDDEKVPLPVPLD